MIKTPKSDKLKLIQKYKYMKLILLHLICHIQICVPSSNGCETFFLDFNTLRKELFEEGFVFLVAIASPITLEKY